MVPGIIIYSINIGGNRYDVFNVSAAGAGGLYHAADVLFLCEKALDQAASSLSGGGWKPALLGNVFPGNFFKGLRR